jgi:regulator of protease activity HflC (stomatin/prohibitin superfamily)
MAGRYGSSFDSQALGRGLRFLFTVVGLAVVVSFFGCQATTRVDAGHVGIRVKLAGSDRGVQDMPVVTGWVIYNPITEQIVIFPTSVQNVIWTANHNEGRPVDESITFSSSEGVNVNADVGLSFHIEPTLAPKLYGRFRQNDMLALADTYVHNVVREAFNDVTSKMAVQDIYGAGKSKMLAEVTKKCRDALDKDGFVIDQLTINGALRLPQNVADAINRAMEATQNAGSRSGRGHAPEGRGRSRRDPHPRALRGEGERDHPVVDEPRGAPVPRARALGRQAAHVQRQRSGADADVRRVEDGGGRRRHARKASARAPRRGRPEPRLERGPKPEPRPDPS